MAGALFYYRVIERNSNIFLYVMLESSVVSLGEKNK